MDEMPLLPLFGMSVVVLSAGILVLWTKWYNDIVAVTQLGATEDERKTLCLGPLVCLMLLTLVLTRGQPLDLAVWTVQRKIGAIDGVFWLAVVSQAMTFLGLSARDDALERRNGPAAWAIVGAQVAATLSFAGAVAWAADRSLSFWAVRGVGVASLATLFAGWWALERLASVSEGVTVERDAGAALRLASFLVALGFLTGQ